MICCTQNNSDRILKSLKNRLDRFSLLLSQDKTKVVAFDKYQNNKQGTFDFSGFTFYIGKSLKGWPIIKLKTSNKKFRAKLENVKVWCKRNRHKGKLLAIGKVFVSKLRGHIRYYGVSHNTKYVEQFIYEAGRIFYKWINRRSQRKSISWEQFELFLRKHPIPRVKVYHSLF